MSGEGFLLYHPFKRTTLTEKLIIFNLIISYKEQPTVSDGTADVVDVDYVNTVT
jgi:hypothetical protein